MYDSHWQPAISNNITVNLNVNVDSMQNLMPSRLVDQITQAAVAASHMNRNAQNQLAVNMDMPKHVSVPMTPNRAETDELLKLQ